MSLNLAMLNGNVLGQQTASAGTLYYAVVPGKVGVVTRVPYFALVSAGTANNGYWMRPLGRSKTVASYTTSDSAIVLDSDPSPSGNALAAGDQVVLQCTDGTYRRAQVLTWVGGTKTVTFTAALPAAVAQGATIWNFGIFTDTDPASGVAHSLFISVASAQKVYTFAGGGIKGWLPGDPLLFYCPNATAVTSLDYAEYGYTVE